jgi:hypothetical protein
MIGLPAINWQEPKKYDKLIQTDNANIPTEQKSISDYLDTFYHIIYRYVIRLSDIFICKGTVLDIANGKFRS